eukprot:TRINITY_DN49861_c0_g1_i1.p1 TRINITY_DN49861_c0_g1~~TRINITY_DN49861_c0_g1_i1.p1  ORF type:complete len:114 (-),score=22.53 TRINITY_DN49861_c0_g1_i1:268-609(-)
MAQNHLRALGQHNVLTVQCEAVCVAARQSCLYEQILEHIGLPMSAAKLCQEWGLFMHEGEDVIRRLDRGVLSRLCEFYSPHNERLVHMVGERAVDLKLWMSPQQAFSEQRKSA